MLLATVADQLIVAATVATLSFQQSDSDGITGGTDPGTVTVGVTSSNGDEVIAPGTATDGATTAARTVTLTPAQTASIDWLTATWKNSDGVTLRSTVHGIIGSPLLSPADMALYAPGVQLDTATFVQRRYSADRRFHEIAKRGLSPRFAVERVQAHEIRISEHGRGGLLLRFPELRSVRWATDSNGDTIDVSSVGPDDSGIAWLPSNQWPCGHIDIGYEYGYDSTPDDLREAAATYMRVNNGGSNGAIDPRATTFTNEAGATTQYAVAGLGPFQTGIPTVDAVLATHTWNVPGLA